MDKHKFLLISSLVLIIILLCASYGCLYPRTSSQDATDAHTHEEIHAHDAYAHPSWLVLSNEGILSLQLSDYYTNSIDIIIFEFPEGSSYWMADSLYGELSRTRSHEAIIRHADNPGPTYTLPKDISDGFIDQIEFTFFDAQDKPIDSTRLCVLFSETDALFHAFETEPIIEIGANEYRSTLEWANEDMVKDSRNHLDISNDYIVVGTTLLRSGIAGECSMKYELIVEQNVYEKVNSGELDSASLFVISSPQTHIFHEDNGIENCILCGYTR